MNTMEYKGYTAVIEYDDSIDGFHGEVVDIKDVISFEGRNPDELRDGFKTAVDAYLAFCEEEGESPDKPFPGKFNLRLSPALYRDAVVAAKREGKSVNALIVEQIARTIQKSKAA